MAINVNPTRMELKKLKLRLITAKKGHRLLKNKRDELMKTFLDIVRKNKELRENVEKNIMNVHSGFEMAAAGSSPYMFEEALMIPAKTGTLSVSSKNVMSVNVPVFDFSCEDRTSDLGVPYSLISTSGEIDTAIESLNLILNDLILLAQYEKSAQMLSDEIEKTRRRVNALEYIMIPQLEETIKSISMKLEENERGNLTRLMKVKDMMIKEQLEKKLNG